MQEDLNYFDLIRAFGTLQLSDDELEEWTK